jgi:hypothetical protein
MDWRTKGVKDCVDGKRKRRHSGERAKRQWYAKHRMLRFAKHFGFGDSKDDKAA